MAFSANELAPVDAIPVPPFANEDQARAFVRMLMVYVAHLRDGSRVELTQFALGDVLEREYAMLARRWQPYPSDTVMRIAINLRFPAPWTPHGLVGAFIALGWRPWADSGGATATALGYRSDPDFEAERQSDGRWAMTWIERGVRRSGGDAASDYGMVMCLMGHEAGRPYPYGWAVRESPEVVGELRSRAEVVLGGWEHEAELPYLAKWGT